MGKNSESNNIFSSYMEGVLLKEANGQSQLSGVLGKASEALGAAGRTLTKPFRTQQQSQNQVQQQSTSQQAATPQKSNVSVVDYLTSQNKPSDFKSRSELAKQMGIQDYKGTAEQNIQLLNSLKQQASAPKGTVTVQPATQQSPSITSPEKPIQVGDVAIKNPSGTTTPSTTTQTSNQQPVSVGGITIGNPSGMQQTTPTQVAQAPSTQAPQKIEQQTPSTPTQQTSDETPFMRDLKKFAQNMYGGANQDEKQVASNQQIVKPEAEEETANEENCEDCEKNCKECEKNKSETLNKITVQEKVNISKFLKHLSEKNYSSAHKYLKAIVDDKVKSKIAQRLAKN